LSSLLPVITESRLFQCRIRVDLIFEKSEVFYSVLQ
jgi:hypothetical protein